MHAARHQPHPTPVRAAHTQSMRQLREQVQRFAAAVAGAHLNFGKQKTLDSRTVGAVSGSGVGGEQGRTAADKRSVRRSGEPNRTGQTGAVLADHGAEHDVDRCAGARSRRAEREAR